MNTVKLSDGHLKVINKALETYYRLKSGQIDIALDTAYSYRFDRETTDEISDFVRARIFPELKNRAAYGVGAPEIDDASIAYEIRKTFEEYLAVRLNDGYYGHTVDFDGPLKVSDEPLPVVVEHKNFKDFELSPKDARIVHKFLEAKDFEKAWNHIHSLNLNLPKGESIEIIPSTKLNNKSNNIVFKVVLRIKKPRKQ